MDTLFIIRARIDCGDAKNARQLRKDRRALIKAESEIVRLRELIEKKPNARVEGRGGRDSQETSDAQPAYPQTQG